MKSANMEINEYFDTEDALFHYTRLSTAIEHILPDKRLKLSLLRNTNDPAEYKDKSFWVAGPGGFYPDDLPNRYLKAKASVNRIYNECRVSCFCSNKKPIILNSTTDAIDEHGCPNGWTKSRMWSQYAEDHTGICLVFSKEKSDFDIRI